MKRSDSIELKKIRSLLRGYLKESLSKNPNKSSIKDFKHKLKKSINEYGEVMTQMQRKGYMQGEIDAKSGEVKNIEDFRKYPAYYPEDWIRGYVAGVKSQGNWATNFFKKAASGVAGFISQPGIGNRLQ